MNHSDRLPFAAQLSIPRRWFCAAITLGFVLAGQTAATGQTTRERLPAEADRMTAAIAEPASIAILGEPFGVAKIRVPVQPRKATGKAVPIRVSSEDGRVFYPAAKEVTQLARTGPPLVDIAPGRGIGRGRLLGRLTNIIRTVASEEYDEVVAHDVSFLFRGEAPLRVTVIGETRKEFLLQPRAGSVTGTPWSEEAPTHQAVLRDWWEVYTQAASDALESGDYPPLIETYLVAMLSRRLDLPVPEFMRDDDDADEPSIVSTIDLIAGTERMRQQVFREVALGKEVAQGLGKEMAQGQGQAEETTWLPLPDPPSWDTTRDWETLEQAMQLRDSDGNGDTATLAEPDIENLASRVPIDSLYLRFGAFENYLWLLNLSRRYGGDVSKMVTLRGFDYETTQRVERLLWLRTTELAETFGPAVVEDLALVGYDMYLTDGPSVGALIKARNRFLLRTALEADRSTAVVQVPGAKIERLTIDDHPVSLLTTPDHRIRSFLVSDGDYFLVTSSRRLLEAFLECCRGGESLADSRGFQYARRLMPNRNNYLIFAYFSDRFFQNLVSPRYQIERRRRMAAQAEIGVTRLALLAAQHEGSDATQIDELIDGQWVPPRFSQRPDGTGMIVATDEAGATITDSLRGSLGGFLPIADVEIDQVSQSESDWYRERADFYSQDWQQMDPVLLGLRVVSRQPNGIERIAVHGEIAPLVPKKYGWILDQLGPPTTTSVQFAEDDVAAVQAHVQTDLLGIERDPYLLFLAVKDDTLPSPTDLEGLLDKFRALRSLKAYLGAWPEPSVVDQLPLGLGEGVPVGPGMTRLLGGLYRYQGNAFSILSFAPDIITATLPQLKIIQREQPAQVRVHIDNLHGTQLEAWLNQQLYRRGYQVSLAGARLLDHLTSQMGVPPEQAQEVAAQLLDAKLQCALGGDYLLARFPQGQSWWTTAIDPASTPEDIPIGYLAPILDWFRGASGRVTRYDARLVVDLLVDVETEDP